MPHAKRWLYLVHRWLGVLLCAFFAMWFLSGVVMMYVGYPKLTQAERLAHLPPLRSATLGTEPLLEPADALAHAGLTGPLQDLRLAVASGARAVRHPESFSLRSRNGVAIERSNIIGRHIGQARANAQPEGSASPSSDETAQAPETSTDAQAGIEQADSVQA